MFSTVWNTQTFTELGKVERDYGGDTGDLVEKKESPKRETAVKPVISLPSEKWVLKIGFLRYKIGNKYKKAKIKNLE